MKSYKTIIAILMIISMIAVGTAFAQGPGRGGHGFAPEEAGEPGPRPEPPPDRLLGRYIHLNMALAVLSDITGVDTTTLSTAIEDTHMRDVLDTYSVDMETFQAAMQEKVLSTGEKAVECGLITQTQLDEITASMEEDTDTDETTEDTDTDTSVDTDTTETTASKTISRPLK